MKTPGYYIINVLLVIMPMLTSCRKELCYNHFPMADLQLSWEREWERDYGMAHAGTWNWEYYGFNYQALLPDKPELVMLVKYTTDGTPAEQFLSTDGGEVILSKNKIQSFLLYNGDTEYIVLSDMASLPNARASATSRSRSTISYLAEQHPNTRSTNPPDILYSAFIEKIPEIDLHEVREIPIKMQPLVYTYVIRYEFEHGQQYIALARGALGGMAESVFLRDGSTSDESAIILYDCDIKSYGCEAHVRSFGIPGFPDKYYGRATKETDEEQKYTLNLEVMLKNGKTLEFNFDITDQMAKQPRGGVIKVSGLRIEDQQNMSDSDFKVDVNDWGDHQEVDLPVKFPV